MFVLVALNIPAILDVHIVNVVVQLIIRRHMSSIQSNECSSTVLMMMFVECELETQNKDEKISNGVRE